MNVNSVSNGRWILKNAKQRISFTSSITKHNGRVLKGCPLSRRSMSSGLKSTNVSTPGLKKYSRNLLSKHWAWCLVVPITGLKIWCCCSWTKQRWGMSHSWGWILMLSSRWTARRLKPLHNIRTKYFVCTVESVNFLVRSNLLLVGEQAAVGLIGITLKLHYSWKTKKPLPHPRKR